MKRPIFAPEKAECFSEVSPQLELTPVCHLDISPSLGRSEWNVSSLGRFWPSWGVHLLLGSVVN